MSVFASQAHGLIPIRAAIPGFGGLRGYFTFNTNNAIADRARLELSSSASDNAAIAADGNSFPATAVVKIYGVS